MNRPTQEDLIKAIKQEKDLSDFGIGVFNPKQYSKDERAQVFKKDRSHLKSDRLRMFQICCAWLLLRQTCKTETSYVLKHRAERHFGEYVTNGAFIAALIHLGIDYKKRPNSPNVDVILSGRSIKGTQNE